jgi:hypothetical protein
MSLYNKSKISPGMIPWVTMGPEADPPGSCIIPGVIPACDPRLIL